MIKQFLFSSLVVGSLAGQSLPLRIQGVYLDANHNFTAQVLNTGAKTITSFSLREKQWPDALMCECTVKPRETFERGSSWAVSSEDRANPPRVVAIVFADNSAIGDEAEIKNIFDFRRGVANEFKVLWKAIQPMVDNPGFQSNAEKIIGERKALVHQSCADRECVGIGTADDELRNMLTYTDNTGAEKLRDRDELVSYIQSRLAFTTAHMTRRAR